MSGSQREHSKFGLSFITGAVKRRVRIIYSATMRTLNSGVLFPTIGYIIVDICQFRPVFRLVPGYAELWLPIAFQ